ncbi:P-loop containing nucleoside triphosphate hydrolase protein [Achaetomium macrosporum]|uniref:P-loop containing nucleoside triphosphate hydrolase protein n=1 Tax=Achaetomium macrosporum TaxID=79813 RepID=A0AAN7HD56_9PEZI|nr:P-loop containing nucleoside triphosphate hydrolase protein [Achaetomium macrosporum]
MKMPVSLTEGPGAWMLIASRDDTGQFPSSDGVEVVEVAVRAAENSGESASSAVLPSSGSNSNSKNGKLSDTVRAKTFFEGPQSRRAEGFFDWVDYPPRQQPSKSAAKAQDHVAIKVFKIKGTEKPVNSHRTSSLRYYALKIQNPLLVAALGEALKKPDIPLDASGHATFYSPFSRLYFGYDDIVAKQRALDQKDALEASLSLRLLILLLDKIFADTRARVESLRARGLMSFKFAWALFPKDTTVISWYYDRELLSKVTETRYQCLNGKRMLIIQAKVLRFDGRAFLWLDHSLTIDDFSGDRPITELDAYPLELHDAAVDVRARLTARGRRVLDYQGLTYANYTGIAIHASGRTVEKHNVDGRVLIDAVGYKKYHLVQGSCEGSDPRSMKRLSPAAQGRNKEAILALEAKEPQLMYMLPVLEGYALKNKLWVTLFVEHISTMVWNDDAFDHLVYNEQQKDLVLSFVESHSNAPRPGTGMRDVIAGKGKGLVMVLSGPPGTGKTLMAEAVADRTRRPLFHLQAEDLGISAATLGANIKKVFEMATEWNAVLLLGEAGVFMTGRYPQDIARDELVSIFLRELECFCGVIFLTTNLYSTINSAFRSHVSLHLLFSALTPEVRMLIWRKFLDRLPLTDKNNKNKLTPDREQEVGEEREELNGREIKTAVKMTKTWCDHKGYALTLSRLEDVIKVTSPFARKHSQEQNLMSLEK